MRDCTTSGMLERVKARFAAGLTSTTTMSPIACQVMGTVTRRSGWHRFFEVLLDGCSVPRAGHIGMMHGVWETYLSVHSGGRVLIRDLATRLHPAVQTCPCFRMYSESRRPHHVDISILRSRRALGVFRKRLCDTLAGAEMEDSVLPEAICA